MKKVHTTRCLFCISGHIIILFCTFLGGWVGSEIGKTMERYDPEENKWEVIGSMAVPRYYFGCCELQGVSPLFVKLNVWNLTVCFRFPSGHKQFHSQLQIIQN